MKTTPIGLIGGIASGKSLAAEYFEALGVPLIDTDQIARLIVKKGSPLLNTIAQHYGSSILLPDGELHRKALRDIILKNSEEKLWLETLLHPVIRQEVEAAIKNLGTPYCLVAIPLLKNREDYPFLKRILMLDTPMSLQLQRLMDRDHIDEALARTMILSQPSRQWRLSLADDVIVNDNDKAFLKTQVQDLHQKYLKLSKEKQ